MKIGNVEFHVGILASSLYGDRHLPANTIVQDRVEAHADVLEGIRTSQKFEGEVADKAVAALDAFAKQYA